MIHSLGKRFDVTVQHGASAATTHRMPSPMNIEPFRGGFFAAAYLVTHRRIENLRAAAGDRAQPRRAQSLQCITNWHTKNALGQVTNFDRGESLYVQLRIESA